MKNIVYKIREIRENKKLTQEYVASLLGISPLAYGNIERGKTTLNLKKLYDLASIFEVEVEELLENNHKINITAPVHNLQNGNNIKNGVSEDLLININRLLERLCILIEKKLN